LEELSPQDLVEAPERHPASHFLRQPLPFLLQIYPSSSSAQLFIA
jgi:hypothetical protein